MDLDLTIASSLEVKYEHIWSLAGCGAQAFLLGAEPDCWKIFVQQWHTRFRIFPQEFLTRKDSLRWSDELGQKLNTHWLDAWVRNQPSYYQRTREEKRTDFVGCMSCGYSKRGPCHSFRPGLDNLAEDQLYYLGWLE